MFRKILLFVLCLSWPLTGVQAAEVDTNSGEQALAKISDAAPSESDLKLTDDVRKALKADAALLSSLANVQLKTVSNVVYLKGAVSSAKEKASIEKKARACPGVADVQNFIQVGGN